MRQFISLTAAAVATLLAFGARAQDFFTSTSGPAVRFGGLEAGADFGAAVGGAGDISTSGVGVGVHAGYNLQNGPIVGGLEGDSMLGSISGDGRRGTLSQNWVSSVRVRGGWAFGNLLAYGTIGPAWATSDFNRAGFSYEKTLHGLTYGVGGEFALTQMITARAELRHYDFGTATYYMPSGVEKLSSGNNLLMVGLGAHF